MEHHGFGVVDAIYSIRTMDRFVRVFASVIFCCALGLRTATAQSATDEPESPPARTAQPCLALSDLQNSDFERLLFRDIDIDDDARQQVLKNLASLSCRRRPADGGSRESTSVAHPDEAIPVDVAVYTHCTVGSIGPQEIERVHQRVRQELQKRGMKVDGFESHAPKKDCPSDRLMWYLATLEKLTP